MFLFIQKCFCSSNISCPPQENQDRLRFPSATKTQMDVQMWCKWKKCDRQTEWESRVWLEPEQKVQFPHKILSLREEEDLFAAMCNFTTNGPQIHTEWRRDWLVCLCWNNHQTAARTQCDVLLVMDVGDLWSLMSLYFSFFLVWQKSTHSLVNRGEKRVVFAACTSFLFISDFLFDQFSALKQM